MIGSEQDVIRRFDSPLPSLNDQSILITGGTGSFGKAFVRELLECYSPRRLIVFSRDEMKQSEMAHDFPTSDHKALRYFIGDVRSRDRLEMAMRDVDIVIHAAALKQVPTAEYNPFECINTNVIGAENVVQAALRTGVRQVIALSTDKATNPINLYGASKLASDKIFVAANHLSGANGPIFSVVRYGNVIGSRGSVVPLFRRLIAEKVDSLPITDARMTRFWITLQQGVNFVLSSLAIMKGGEVFVPKIPSMNIADLAKSMAPNLPHRLVGIRPGEKLHEVMISSDDSRSTVELKDRYVILPSFNLWSEGAPSFESALQVPEGFSYSSDLNSEWLDSTQLQRMIAGKAD